MKTTTYLAMFLGTAVFLNLSSQAQEPKTNAATESASSSKSCVNCHRKQSPALVMEWERSRHAQMEVSCLDCHGANEGEPDAWKHKGHWVSALVTPKDCAQCHEAEVKQFAQSHHAKGGEILASLDNVL